MAEENPKTPETEETPKKTDGSKAPETPEEKKAKKEKQKQARAMKIAERRPLKNFGWWALGFVSPLILAVAATGIVGGVLPIKVVMNDRENQYVDEALGNQTILNFLLNYQDYGVGSLPIVKTLLQQYVENGELGKYVSIDYDKLDEVQFSNIDFQYILNNCLEVTATLRSIGVMDSLGDLANLKTLTTSEKVEGEIDKTASDFNPALYYYQSSGRLKRAFDNDGNYVEGAEGQDLYYPALADVSVLDLMGCGMDRLMMEKINDLLGAFTSFGSDSMIAKIFDGYTIKTLGTFDPNAIALSTVLPINSGNQMLYNVLCSACGGIAAEEVTIGDLSTMDFNSVRLVDVLEPTPENLSLFDTLRAATGKSSNDEITVGDLANANLNDVPLVSMISLSGNESFYDILCQATGKSDPSSITVGDMNSFNFDNILLSTVAPGLSDDLKNVLVSACGATSFDEISIADLQNFDINAIPLSMVIPNTSDNQTLITVLMQATGADDYGTLTVSSLSGFSLDNVLLTTVMPENDSLFTILSEATGVPKDQLKVSSLTSFDVTTVKLSTVMGSSSGNPILDALLADDTTTVGNIGDKLNNLTFHSVYGEDCFTQDASNSFTPGDHYVKVGEDFIYDNDGDYTGDYYVSKSSGMMLLYCWSASNIDASNGRPGKYTPATTSFSDFSSSDASTITGATIYELVASGILNDSGYSDNLKKRTLQEVITAAALVLG